MLVQKPRAGDSDTYKQLYAQWKQDTKEQNNMRTLKYHSTNNGHCIVYYTDENRTMNRTLYGMQLETTRPAIKFNLLVCSKDGEPSHRVPLENYNVPMSGGDQSTDKELNEFLTISQAVA